MKSAWMLFVALAVSIAVPASAAVPSYQPAASWGRGDIPAAAPASEIPRGLAHIAGAQVVGVGLLNVNGGIEYGSGIQFYSANTRDFNATRFLLGGGYGMIPNLEVGGRLAYESNSGELLQDNWGGVAEPVDDGGLDYISAYAKYSFTNEISNEVAGEVFLSFAGDNNVYYGMDGFDFGVKGIFSSDMGIGILHGELGWIAKGGESDIGGFATKYSLNKANYDNMFTYGVGFEYPYRPELSVTGEIYGWQSPYGKLANQDAVEGGDNFLLADLGVKYAMAPDLMLNGSLGAGLSKGAPDFQLFVGINKLIDMGGAPRTSDYPQSSSPSRATSYPTQPTQPSYPAQPSQPSRPVPPPAPIISPQEQARQAIERGNLAFQNLDYNAAAAAYKQATQADPQNGLAHYNLGVAYYYLGRYNDAVGEYQSAIAINPGDVESHLYLGLAHYQIGDTQKAIAEWQQVLKLDPNNQLAQQNLKALGAY